MRMPPDDLCGDRKNRVGEIEAAGLGGDLRVEHALKEHIPELTGQFLPVAAIDCLERFVGLFEQERRQRRVRLFLVPRASVPASQGIHRTNERGHRRACAPRALRGTSLRAALPWS